MEDCIEKVKGAICEVTRDVESDLPDDLFHNLMQEAAEGAVRFTRIVRKIYGLCPECGRIVSEDENEEEHQVD